MDKAHPGAGPGEVGQQPVEGVVADEGPGGVGDFPGQARVHDGSRHGGHGDGGENAVGTAGEDGGLHREIPGVVGDGGGGHVDGDALGGDGIPAPGLADAEDHIGLIRLGGGQDSVRGGRENGGDLQLRQTILPDGIRKTAHGLPGGIDGLPAEGVKTGDEQVFHGHRSFLGLSILSQSCCKNKKMHKRDFHFLRQDCIIVLINSRQEGHLCLHST